MDLAIYAFWPEKYVWLRLKVGAHFAKIKFVLFIYCHLYRCRLSSLCLLSTRTIARSRFKKFTTWKFPSVSLSTKPEDSRRWKCLPSACSAFTLVAKGRMDLNDRARTTSSILRRLLALITTRNTMKTNTRSAGWRIGRQMIPARKLFLNSNCPWRKSYTLTLILSRLKWSFRSKHLLSSWYLNVCFGTQTIQRNGLTKKWWRFALTLRTSQRRFRRSLGPIFTEFWLRTGSSSFRQPTSSPWDCHSARWIEFCTIRRSAVDWPASAYAAMLPS